MKLNRNSLIIGLMKLLNALIVLVLKAGLAKVFAMKRKARFRPQLIVIFSNLEINK